MLIRRKRLFWFGAGLLAVGLTFLILPPYSAYCEEDHTNNYYCSIYELAVALSAFVETYSGAFTALATIAIAWFTLTLKRSTDKLWEAGESQLRHAETEAVRDDVRLQEQMSIARQNADAAIQQARTAEAALTQLERPYIFIFNISGLELNELTEEGIILTATYSVANYGKTPAIIKYAQAVLAIGVDPPFPDRLPANHTLVTSPILAAGELRPANEIGYVWTGGSEFDEDGATIPSIPNGYTLYLWVIVTYRGPFTDQHELGLAGFTMKAPAGSLARGAAQNIAAKNNPLMEGFFVTDRRRPLARRSPLRGMFPLCQITHKHRFETLDSQTSRLLGTYILVGTSRDFTEK